MPVSGGGGGRRGGHRGGDSSGGHGGQGEDLVQGVEVGDDGGQRSKAVKYTLTLSHIGAVRVALKIRIYIVPKSQCWT